MYFFFGDGELGNQLFQFAFLNDKIKKKVSIESAGENILKRKI